MSAVRCVAAAALSLVIGGCDWYIPPDPDIVYLIPEDFHGWMCVDFDVTSAPPLPREGKALIVRPRGSDIIETSDPHDSVWNGEVRIEAGSQRRRVPEGVRSGHTMSMTGPNEPFQRICRFVGTIDQEDAAGNPPGFNDGWFAPRPIPASERAALVALFEATDGPHWTHKVGWLGPSGTECGWHGVDCDAKLTAETTNVTSVQLFENNLRGSVPEAFGDLPHLTSLDIYGNALSGTLPASLLRRWLSGELDVSAIEGSLLTSISEIEIEYTPTFSVCAKRRIVLGPDGKASMYQERCRKLFPVDWRPYCEIKQGWFFNQDFGRLAHTIEQSSYFSLKPKYARSVSDSAFEVTRVTRKGVTHQVSDYASAGPQELWTIRQAIFGLADSVRWTETSTASNCPAPASR